MADYLITFMLVLSCIFLLGFGFLIGFLFAWNKLRGFLLPGKKFNILKGSTHEKELKTILINLQKLSVAEVEFVMHFGIWGRPLKIMKSINKDKETFDMVTFDDDHPEFYSDQKEKAKDMMLVARFLLKLFYLYEQQA